MNDGGQAFPVPGVGMCANGEMHMPEAGMTLRDYFAAKALQGMASISSNVSWESVAKSAYEAADEMLKARDA